MPPAIDASPGGAAANSYVTVAEADAYFDARLFSTKWTAADANTKITALLTATARVDQEGFVGERVTLTQRLEWPRSDVEEPDGKDVDSAIIPPRVKAATCEIAVWLLGQSSDPATPDPLAKFASLNVPGGLSFTLRPGARAADTLPDVVARLLAPYRAAPGVTYLDRMP